MPKAEYPGRWWTLPDKAELARMKRPLPPDTGRYRCRSCGKVFAKYAWAEEHLERSGGTLELVLDRRPEP